MSLIIRQNYKNNTGQQRFCPTRKNVLLTYFWTLN